MEDRRDWSRGFAVTIRMRDENSLGGLEGLVVLSLRYG